MGSLYQRSANSGPWSNFNGSQKNSDIIYAANVSLILNIPVLLSFITLLVLSSNKCN